MGNQSASQWELHLDRISIPKHCPWRNVASATTDVQCTRHSSTLQLPSTELAKFRTQTCVWSKFSSSPSSSCPNPSLLYFLCNDDVSNTQLNTGVLSNKETYSPTLIPSSKSCQQAAFSDLPCPLWTKLQLLQANFIIYFSHPNTHFSIKGIQMQQLTSASTLWRPALLWCDSSFI